MTVEYGSGDRVELRLAGRAYTGIVMQRPDLADPGYLTLKLDNGYNIGIKTSEITSLKVLEAVKKPKSTAKPGLKHDASKPVISILSTGGTIASKVDYQTGGVNASFTAEELLEAMPEISNIANIRAKSVMNVMSEDMNPTLWVDLAVSVAEELNSGAEGVVVTHGTDTMHYSTAALSFLLRGLSKPVVFTGAQRSTDRGSADSFLNLLCSVSYATSNVSGVYLVMHGSMSDTHCLAHLGTKVRKMHTTRRDAFQSINSSPLARIHSDGRVEFLSKNTPLRGSSRVTVDSRIEENVALVKAYPGVEPGIFDYLLDNGVKGVVIEGTALGHVPTTIKERSLIPKIEKMVDSGVLVAMTTQCLYGRVNPHVYSNLREVSSRGVVYCEDMLPETAYVKMMWVLGRSKDVEESKALMLQNIAGEITDRTVPFDKFVEI
ncbi:MAG: Glu-tRNA(Gln) amidotransferase subunit GatD [Candidatus Altiarchaeota archaeon]